MMFPRWGASFQKLFRSYNWWMVSVFALMVVIASMVIGFWPKEPAYQRHSASYWLDQQVGWFNPNDSLNAFLGMGDEGAIYLAERVIEEPTRQPKLKLWLMDKLSAYPRFTPEWLKIRSFERRKESALILLKAMGDKGRAASPILMRALEDELRESAQFGASNLRQGQLHEAFVNVGSDDPEAVGVILECAKRWGLPPSWPDSVNKFTPAVNAKRRLLLQLWQNSQKTDSIGAAVLLASVAGVDDQMFQTITAHCQAGYPPGNATVLMVKLLTLYTNRTDAVLPLVAKCIWVGNPKAGMGYIRNIRVPDLELWLGSLASTNPQVLEWMRHFLVDPKVAYKAGIARVIGNIRPKDEEICRRLEGLLGSTDFWTRLAAAEALWKIRQTEKEAIDLVIVQLGHPEVFQVNIAIKGLARIGGKAMVALPKLQELLKHPESAVREKAAEAIRIISGEK